jgi:histidinol-phosphate aminotransferase
MSFLNSRYHKLAPYTPGEQPKIQNILKLNTNESPYPPAPGVVPAVTAASRKLELYSDPTTECVTKPLAKTFGIAENQVIIGNGSDEILAFCFQGFTENGVAFPDLTYGFYEVFSQLYGVSPTIVPLQADFSMDIETFAAFPGTIVLTNPNAPTAIALNTKIICELLAANPKRLIIVDEAYIDFGGQSMVPFINEYPNLLVVGTFSKSRQLAGARLGYAVGNATIINDLHKIKFSFNPYNVNSLTLAAGAATLADPDYFESCRQKVIKTRLTFSDALKHLGFVLPESAANFVFVKHPQVAGVELFHALREHHIIVRWFDKDRIRDYLRITIGTDEQMQQVIAVLTEILTKKGVLY